MSGFFFSFSLLDTVCYNYSMKYFLSVKDKSGNYLIADQLHQDLETVLKVDTSAYSLRKCFRSSVSRIEHVDTG